MEGERRIRAAALIAAETSSIDTTIIPAEVPPQPMQEARIAQNARRRLLDLAVPGNLNIEAMDIACTSCGALHFKAWRVVSSTT